MERILLTAYGILLIIGAYFGWKAGSKISLVMGFISGTLVLLGVYWLGINSKGGYTFLAVISGVLTVMFLIRLIKTLSFMPSGMLVLISLAAFLLTVLKLFHK